MAEEYVESNKRIPSFHVVEESIPRAFYKAMDAVWHGGMTIRTQYDRKNSQGEYIDPPSRDARVLIEIKNPFNQPRYPRLSFCEIGVYIGEIMGCKDHLVVPFSELKEGIKKGKIDSHWPYTYHQRLFSYPLSGETEINQMEKLIERLVESPITRRAVATTRVPEIDAYLPEDLPCLGEVQLRCTRPEADGGEEGQYLNMDTRWRSRDLYKAWCDNVIALTFMQQVLAQKLEKKSGIRTRVGSYADYSTSLHIYGQDFNQIEGNEEKGVRNFFEKFTADSLSASSINSEKAKERLVIPQLQELIIGEQCGSNAKSSEILGDLINGLEEGRYIA